MSSVREERRVSGTEAHEDAFRRIAVQRLKKKRDFKSHLFTYLVVNAALWTIWAVDGAINGFGWPWPVIPTFFWGLFVLGAANDTFRRKPITETEIDREVERIRGSALELEADDDRPH